MIGGINKRRFVSRLICGRKQKLTRREDGDETRNGASSSELKAS
jgi:hypothetical protein